VLPETDRVVPLLVVACIGVASALGGARWARAFMRLETPRLLIAFSFALWLVLAVSAVERTIETERKWNDLTANVYLHRLGLWVRENIPESTIFAAYDSGIFTYTSERHVISLEGLVSDREFLEWGLLEPLVYLEKNKVDFVAGPGRDYADGSARFAYLPVGTYDVEWVPFPGVDLFPDHWSTTYMLVAPRYGTEARAHTIGEPDFGLVRPRTNEEEPEASAAQDAL